jgi:FMN phosphatase YigB (HAD superfamily)
VIAIGFDFDHTLGIDNTLERTVGGELLVRIAGEAGSSIAASAADSAMVAALSAYRSGTASLSLALAGASRATLGAPSPEFERRFRDDAVARAGDFVTPLPGVREMFADLAAGGSATAIFTNGWSPLQERKANIIGYSGEVIVSDSVGVRKPAHAAFDLLARTLGVGISDLWYVGDDPHADIAGAIGAGATGVWYDWEDRAYPVDILQPTYTIHSLLELPALVQGQGRRAANGRSCG